MAAPSAVDALLIVFEALAPEERDEAFERLAQARARHQAGDESDTERMLRSLLRVAEVVGGMELSSDDYRREQPLLVAAGEEVEPLSRVIRHFGSWRRAKEALALSETTTARRIEARFRYRRLGKVWRYTEDTLRETLECCVAYYGHVPQVAEFDWWRDREFELARAEGNDALHLPSANPYRRRWGTWEAALLHFGYTPDEVAERLERP